MKKIVMAVAAVVMVTSGAMAQENKRDGQEPPKRPNKVEMVQRRTDDMAKRYGLNTKQVKELQVLNTKYADKMGHGPHRHHPGGFQGLKDGKKPPQMKDGHRPPQFNDGHRPPMSEEQMQTMKAYEAELQKIMTADQFKAYKEDVQKRHPKKPHTPKGGQKTDKKHHSDLG